MSRRACSLTTRSLLLLASLSAVATAQRAVTVTGHVFASQMPVRGASVRIQQLDLGTTTDAEGRYSFIVPSTKVRGQSVTLTTRYLRFPPKSVEIALTGGQVEQDFDLDSPDTPTGVRPELPPAADSAIRVTQRAPPLALPEIPRGNDPVAGPATRVRAFVPTAGLDSSAFADIPGLVDLGSALAGRFAGLDVRSASTLGGSSALVLRGPRTLTGRSQPLLVVNGILVDNSNITNATQLAGLGGFDYGTAINDFNLEDIAAVELLSGAEAAMRFGGRAANGALLVTTKSARGLHGFEVSANQQYTREAPLLLPEYQDAYGQGLAGKFSFFDGKGGGTNDAVDQSWGPALQSQPVTQASLREAGRPDVRGWFPQPANVSGYFLGGRTLKTNAAVQGASETGQIRVSLSDRSAKGLTPLSAISQRSMVITASEQQSPRLQLRADLQYYGTSGSERPGTGFDESNPMSVFAHMGRQVDVAAYETLLRDASGKQLSWNYSGHNNPYWASSSNVNEDSRSRWLGGASATYAVSEVVSATLRATADQTSEARRFTIASGWMGGFPYFLGRGDFSTGGFQTDDISVGQKTVDFLLRATPRTTGSIAYVLTGGVGRRSDDLHTIVTGSDKATDTTTPPVLDRLANAGTTSFLGGVEATLHGYATLDVSARHETSSLLSVPAGSTLYPAITASVDIARLRAWGPPLGRVERLAVHAGWSRSGNEATATLLHRFGLSPSAAGDTLAQVSSPEVTTGKELGVSLRMLSNRVGLEFNTYRDRSENLLFPTSTGFAQSGVLTNNGLEATIGLVPVHGGSVEWDVGLTYGKNSNLVESLSADVSSLPLAPAFGGAEIRAIAGSPLSALVGTRFLRTADGQLLLRDGHPLPDSLVGPQVLAQSLPVWIGGLTTSLRAGVFEFSVQVDTHRGGKVFSASNRAGAYAGVLLETGVRPDTGLLIVGQDAVTGTPNTTHVTTEDYYHSLGAITERWLYDASFVKLRQVRASADIPLQFLSPLHTQSLRAAVVGRNLFLWASAPNFDPESVLSATSPRGAEMGQLPTTKSIGVQVTLAP